MNKARGEALDTIVRSEMKREEEIQMYVRHAGDHLDDKQQPNGKYVDYFETGTQQELRENIDPLLMESATYDESTLWPFVKKISIGVRGSRILERHTIADLPGVSDTNQVRVNSTYEHIDQCNEIWIVGRSGRIITDDAVDGLLQRYGKATLETRCCSLNQVRREC